MVNWSPTRRQFSRANFVYDKQNGFKINWWVSSLFSLKRSMKRYLRTLI